MNWYKQTDRDPQLADPSEMGYKSEWGEHHGPVEYTPDSWNYGPRGYPDRSGPMPLPKKLYHVTPNPKEIMQEGFKSFKDMSQQTFGGHGEYVSFTSLENAKIYQESLKDFTRLANEEYGIWDLPRILNKWKVPKEKWDQLVSNAWSNIRDYLKNNKDTLNDFRDIDRTMHEQGSFNKLEEFLDQHPEWTAPAISRIFEVMSFPSEAGFPLFMGTTKVLMERLKGKLADDIAILEADIPPLQWRSDVNIFDEDMSDKYTVNTGEQEWRVWNPQSISREKIRRIAGSWYKRAQSGDTDPATTEAIIDDRAHEVGSNDFLSYHQTGGISEDAYDNYGSIEGISWLGKPEDYPYLLKSQKFGDETIEFRQKREKNKYVRHDDNDEIARDNKGLALYLTDEEVLAKGYPLYDPGVTAFNEAGQPIGFASNEFGATGVWVVKDYQRSGIGTDLMYEFRKQVKPKKRIGQMTPSGESMTRSYHKRLVEEALAQGKKIPTHILEEYGIA